MARDKFMAGSAGSPCGAAVCVDDKFSYGISRN
jgi:hypothetical protein